MGLKAPERVLPYHQGKGQPNFWNGKLKVSVDCMLKSYFRSCFERKAEGDNFHVVTLAPFCNFFAPSYSLLVNRVYGVENTAENLGNGSVLVLAKYN